MAIGNKNSEKKGYGKRAVRKAEAKKVRRADDRRACEGK
jgi:hypothetical protein